MKKVRAFIKVFLWAGGGAFIGVFILGLCAHLIFTPYTVDVAFFSAIGAAIGIGIPLAFIDAIQG